MKLIIQIPCLNESETLPQVFAGIPRKIHGIDVIETLVIDDGSSDNTYEVAKFLGATHVIRNCTNKGLAASFSVGVNTCLKENADIIVNMDGDNQYPGDEIEKLVLPLIEKRADICIGNRQTDTISHFSPLKKILQRIGSRVVRKLSGVNVPDAVSGFRAMNRKAALNLSILSSFSYTIEMLIQAGNLQLCVTHVPILVNPSTRKSRLFKSNRQFITQAILTMLRSYVMYQPLKTFFSLAIVFFLIGAIPIARFLYYYFSGNGDGHIQSLILGSTSAIVGFLCLLLALIADIIAKNRMLLHKLLVRARERELHRENKFEGHYVDRVSSSRR